MVHIKIINGRRYYYKSKRVPGKKNPTSICLGPVDKRLRKKRTRAKIKLHKEQEYVEEEPVNETYIS
jgi:hypothetical protein